MVSTMRKIIALLLTFTILVVSSLPAVAEAAMCAMPAHSMAQQQADGIPARVAMNHHEAKFTGDWQTCRIECGCGCHRSIDGLPHLLSPSSLDTGALAVVTVTVHIPHLPMLFLHACWQDLSTPPPITI